jgi:hypothetical protein
MYSYLSGGDPARAGAMVPPVRWSYLLDPVLDGLVVGKLMVKVKEAKVPLPSVPAEPPTYRTTLEGGAVVVGYLVKD